MKKVEIYEVSPRDGFQGIKTFIPTDYKIQLIEEVIRSGVSHIEFTSFVSPKAIPQLADAEIVAKSLLEKYPEADLFALVPNLRGATTAVAAGLSKLVYVVSLSVSHNQANINRTHEKSLEEFLRIKEEFPDVDIILDLATAFGCPFEGKYRDCENLLRFIAPYVKNGILQCCLCDTIGIADPGQVADVITAISHEYPSLNLMTHFHDTRGLGIANSITALNLGVNRLQASIGGLGGCPFAPGASGNIATEDLVWALNEMGYHTGIDVDCLTGTAKRLHMNIEGNYSGHQILVNRNENCL